MTESKEWYLYKQIIGEPVGEAENVDEVKRAVAAYPLYTITTQVKRLHQFYMWNHVLYMVRCFILRKHIVENFILCVALVMITKH